MAIFRGHASRGSCNKELDHRLGGQSLPSIFPGNPANFNRHSFCRRQHVRKTVTIRQTRIVTWEATAPGNRLIQGAVGCPDGRSRAQSAFLRLSVRFLATTPTSTADQRITESGSGLLTIPLVELPDDEPPLPLAPAVVVAAGGESAVMVIPCVSGWSSGGSLAKALLMLRAKLRTPLA